MRLLLLTGALLSLLLPETVSAQTREISSGLIVGSGLQMGGGQGSETVLARSPLFLDLAMRTWTDEEADLLLGGSLRVELDGPTSVAAVPRAELERRLGPLSLRPGIGLPLFFAPFTMIGIEGSLTVRLPLGAGFGVVGAILVDAFVVGTDVPEGSAVIMFNGAVGVDLVL